LQSGVLQRTPKNGSAGFGGGRVDPRSVEYQARGIPDHCAGTAASGHRRISDPRAGMFAGQLVFMEVVVKKPGRAPYRGNCRVRCGGHVVFERIVRNLPVYGVAENWAAVRRADPSTVEILFICISSAVGTSVSEVPVLARLCSLANGAVVLYVARVASEGVIPPWEARVPRHPDRTTQHGPLETRFQGVGKGEGQWPRNSSAR